MTRSQPIRSLRILLLAPFLVGAPSEAQRVVENSCSSNTTGLINEFGRAVSPTGDVNGDGKPQLLVGAPMEYDASGCGCYSGAVHLSRWGVLIRGDDEGDRFGSSVAGGLDLDGDAVTDGIAGAPGDDDTGAEAGSVRAFNCAGLVLYTAYGSGAGDDFGTRLTALEDLDGDGRHEVLVGAPQQTSGGAGYARVVSGQSGATLRTHLGQSPGDGFGLGLTSLPDLDGDGCGDYAIGAPYENGRGRVRVFSGLSGAFVGAVDGPNLGGDFGYALASGADVDRDGIDELLVGAPGAGLAPGRVHAYSGADGSELLVLTGTTSDGWFGAALAGTRDFDGDGHGDVIVGEPEADPHAPACTPGTGSAVVVSGRDGRELARLGGGSSCARLGVSVASGADFDRDGLPDVLVGGVLGNDGYGDRGCVTAIARASRERIDHGPDEPSRYGTSVAGIGDQDGDGAPDLLVGAPGGLDSSGQATGAARVVSGRSGAVLREFFGAASGDRLGQRVASAGDVDGDGVEDVIAGSADVTPFPAGAGYARVYSGASGALLYDLPGPGTPSFGAAVAGGGDVDGDGFADLIVGATHGVEGSVRVYSGVDGAELYAFDDPSGFSRGSGASVSFLADVNGDGLDEFLFGVPGSDPDPPYWASGHVELRSGADGTLLQTFGTFYNGVGIALARLGDLDADGFEDFAYSSWDPQPLHSYGSVHVVSGATLTELWSIEGSTPYTGITFGYSLAAVGDQDGDGVADLAVGIPGTIDDHAQAIGAVSVRSGADGTPIGHCSGYGGWDYFGYSVTGLGDVNGDGQADFAIGAPTEPANASGANAGQNRVQVVLSNALLKRKHGQLTTNSSGRSARIDASGYGSLALGALTLELVDAPPRRSASFLMSRVLGDTAALQLGSTTAGFASLLPGASRFRFLGSSITAVDGAAELAVDFTRSPAALILAGTSWSFRCVFRDQRRMLSSDAVRITFFP